jgi:hypothetical protein
MLRRLQITSIFVAWLLATGSHWEMVQTFAWGRMILNEAKSMSLSAAVQETLSGEKPCAVCVLVAAAKQQKAQPGNPAPSNEGPTKIFLVCHVPAPLAEARAGSVDWTAEDDATPDSARPAPLLMPPRRLAA